MSEPETRAVPKRLGLMIAAGVLVPIFAVGFTLYTTLGGAKQPSFEVVQDYLRTPELVPERARQAGDELRRVQINQGIIEVYDLGGQRYSISSNGAMLRRGGASPVPARSFAIDSVDFTRLPAILAAAAERTGASPTQATLEYVGDELLWAVTIWAEDGSNLLYYSLDAELRQGSNAR